jgi:DNA-binding MarR family transcriptional regulator
MAVPEKSLDILVEFLLTIELRLTYYRIVMSKMAEEKLVQKSADLIRQLRHVLQQKSVVTWFDLDLTLPQLKTLLFISYHGPTNSKMIAEKFGVTPSNVTRTINVLVKQKLVSRRENPVDRRFLELRLTGRGEEMLTGWKEDTNRFLAELLGGMSEEDLSVLEKGLSMLLKVAESNKGGMQEDGFTP